MPGIFGTFNTASRGMQAQQISIDTASHNISNASTEGFSRQRVNLETSIPLSYSGVGQIGSGVEVTSIIRTRDEFLDVQIRYENSVHGRFEASLSALEHTEMIFLEPSDSGLNEIMNEMWSSWKRLSENPENSNSRTLVTQNSLTFTDTLNSMSRQLDSLKANIVSETEGEVLNANSLLGQIEELNDQIAKLKMNDYEPNDLYDRRDVLLDELSSIINFNTQKDELGRVQITEADSGTNQILLRFNSDDVTPNDVQMSVVRSVEDDDTVHVVREGDISNIADVTIAGTTLKAGDVVYIPINDWENYDVNHANGLPSMVKADIQEGKLAGKMNALKKIDSYQTQLDDLAKAMALSINKVHSDKVKKDGTDDGGINFFVSSNTGEPITAKNITVNSDIVNDVTLVNAGKYSDSPAGDGTRALAIFQLRNTRLPINDATAIAAYVDNNYVASSMSITGNTAGATFDSYYKDTIAKLGIDTQDAETGIENQETLLLQLEQRKESISGVSIDEEVANLIKFQAAYQANAKVISTLTDMLDTVINRMGV